MPAKVISFFNNKGGVSKTTTCFNLGWMLARMGRKVLMIDLDPQCNLSGMALQVSKDGILPESYQKYEKVNIRTSLLPALKSTGDRIKAPECQEVYGNKNLLLLPGNVDMAVLETQLATAMSMGSMMPAMQNVPGSFPELYRLTEKRYGLDYILLDLSPSLGALNQINFLCSDYFIVPVVPDIFSVMAIDSLSRVIPDWMKWATRIGHLGLFDDNDILYKFVPKRPRFLGTVVQRYRLRNGIPSNAFREYIDQLSAAINATLVPRFRDENLLLDESSYKGDFTLAEIPDFNSLIAASQQKHKPVFELARDDLGTAGKVYQEQSKKVNDFKEKFESFANRVEALIYP